MSRIPVTWSYYQIPKRSVVIWARTLCEGSRGPRQAVGHEGTCHRWHIPGNLDGQHSELGEKLGLDHSWHDRSNIEAGVVVAGG